ncbi:MAG: methyltransferase domain-containing protein [Candidatus Micrarchaeota archaeon]
MKTLRRFAETKDGEFLCDEENNLYVRKGEEISRLCLYDQHYYNLRVFSGVPVLEIDGLRMQLIKDFKTPLDYPRAVVAALKLKKTDQVLDTCMGLGYTAIEAAKYAESVITCEVSEPVLKLAKYNPTSAALFTSKNIHVLRGSIAEKISNMKKGTFDAIIHDPPRFSHATELYSAEFYAELRRVLKPDGKLFHYVGSVGKGKGRDISAEAIRRLEAVGFSARKILRLQGILATVKRF